MKNDLEMSPMRKSFGWGMGFGIVFGIFFWSVILDLTGTGAIAERKKIQQEAVDNGVAEWRVNTNGVSYFEWKKFDE